MVLAFLSFQLAAGHDPALGQGATAQTAPEQAGQAARGAQDQAPGDRQGPRSQRPGGPGADTVGGGPRAGGARGPGGSGGARAGGSGSGSGTPAGARHEEQLMVDLSFPSMGSEARVMVDGPRELADSARSWLEEFEARLSRFREDSELCALNRDPRERVPATPLLCDLVRAGLWAAERTGGLVDPTLLGDIERAGYETSRAGARRTDLRDALAAAPARRAAGPDPRGRWRTVVVEEGPSPARPACGWTPAAWARAWRPT